MPGPDPETQISSAWSNTVQLIGPSVAAASPGKKVVTGGDQREFIHEAGLREGWHEVFMTLGQSFFKGEGTQQGVWGGGAELLLPQQGGFRMVAVLSGGL